MRRREFLGALGAGVASVAAPRWLAGARRGRREVLVERWSWAMGQPVHLQSPLVPAILLLVSLASVNLGDHHKKVLWRACVVSLAMLAVGVLVGAIPLMA